MNWVVDWHYHQEYKEYSAQCIQATGGCAQNYS